MHQARPDPSLRWFQGDTHWTWLRQGKGGGCAGQVVGADARTLLHHAELRAPDLNPLSACWSMRRQGWRLTKVEDDVHGLHRDEALKGLVRAVGLPPQRRAVHLCAGRQAAGLCQCLVP